MPREAKFKIVHYHLLQDASHLQSLLTKTSLPIKSYVLKRNVDYFFYWNSYLYGLYRLIRVGHQNHYLSKNYFKPIYYYSANKNADALNAELADTHRILNFFKQATPIRKKIYVSIQPQKNDLGFRLLWCNENSAALFYEHSFTVDDKLKKALLKLNDFYQQKNISESKSTVYFLKELGWMLYQKLYDKGSNSTWLQIIDRATELCCQVEKSGEKSLFPALPLAYAFDGTCFLFERLNVYYHANVAMRGLSFERRYLFFSMALISGETNGDESITNEYEKIQRLIGGASKKQAALKKKSFAIHSQSNVSNPYELVEVFNQYQWVHYTGHGIVVDNDFHFVLANDKKMSARQLAKSGVRFPKVLVLSTCYSTHDSLLQAFFEGGGICLVGAAGFIPSENLTTLFSSFYWQIFYKKYTVMQAFASIQKKASSYHWLASFYLQLHGNPNVRLLD